MSFLQPAMLLALPLIALPILIHLINQRRYRTIDWAAMKFLLAANTMSRGYARIRQWLILALRTLAIAGLIFAISRPLASGWLRLAAPGNIDTTLILIDRSPSMQQQGTRAGQTKLDAARQQLIQALSLLRSNRWVVIDSVNKTPIEIESPQKLATLIETQGVSASADFPGMLQAAYDYLRENRPSRTEVWMCSDLRQNDWTPESARWQVLRDAFLESPVPLRFHLLAYSQPAVENRSIRVTSASTKPTEAGRELLLSFQIQQDQAAAEGEVVRLPVKLELNGSVSEIPVELTAGAAEVKNFAVPLEQNQSRGWGRISLPADANLVDNEFYFVFDNPPPRKTIVVAEPAVDVRPLQLAASITPDSSVQTEVEVIAPEQVAEVDWSQVALLLWQAPLPAGEMADNVQTLLQRGGRVIFFPPEALDDGEFAGVSWKEWEELSTNLPVSSWRQDQDLLANVNSGAALPVGELTISRYRRIQGELTPLASLETGEPLLGRAFTDQNNLYFCAVRPQTGDSSLAREGVVLYVMIQRALSVGAESLGAARQIVAGETGTISIEEWQPLATPAGVLSLEYGVQAGAYEQADKLFAINRSSAEDNPAAVSEEQLSGLFAGLAFDRVDGEVGSGSALLREIWPTFLLVMMLTLVVESVLCIPRRAATQEKSSAFAKGVAA